VTRYIALIEFQDGDYWISFPGIDKTFRRAKTPADVLPQARAFLDAELQADTHARAVLGEAFRPDGMPEASPLPPSLDDAIPPGTPIEPFEGVRLVIFDWEPPETT
jgi:hypothetical protein